MIQLSIEAIVVLLPEPVTPASSTMPWSNLHRFSIDRRQVQALEVGNPVVDAAGDQADVAELLQQVDAEPPVDRRRRRTMWAKSAPPSRSKILRLRSFIIGKQSRTISSSSIGPRFIGRSVPLTRTMRRLADLQVQVARLRA